jgi:hypothetical protein
MFDDRKQCIAGRDKAVADYLKANPTAVARKADLVADRKPMQDDETTIVHSVTRYACLPDTAKEPTFGGSDVPGVPGDATAPGEPAAPPLSPGR